MNGPLQDGAVLQSHDLEQILQWNKVSPSPEPACVHELIEHHVETRSGALAVHAWDGDLTYARLNELATSLAGHLVSLGAGRERIIPLCFEKSMWAVVSMLAVLKSGAACAFLEPTHPIQRIRGMLNDMKAEVLLCSPCLAPRFMKDAETIHVMPITHSLLSKVTYSNSPNLPRVQPSYAAICLFTSGSTGKPKGIIQEHSTAAFSAQTCSRVFGIDSSSRVLQWAAYCFDMSIIDMLMTLVGGGCICIPSEVDRTDNLVQTMRKMSVNFAAMTPSFAQTIKPGRVPSMKTIVFGGESVAKDHLAGWPSDIRIINAYGPAESSVCVAGNARQDYPANIGRAVGAVTWIVHENDCTKLASIGAIGEILIEGPLLARGYLNDPGKTALSFITDPPWLVQARGGSSRPMRLYKTGDLARYDKDGTIVLMGRKDTQIKLRGQRIETAEIENHIQSILPADMRTVVDVIVPCGGPGTQKLAAFITLEAGTTIPNTCNEVLLSISGADKARLQPYLQFLYSELPKSLPAYMIPSYFIPLRNLPLMISGKIDRKKLRCIGSSLTIPQIREMTTVSGDAGERPTEFHPNKTMEQQLLALWCRILRLNAKDIRPNDDFFKLGGDSITVMQLIAAAATSRVRLTTTEIFHHPTLTAMSSIAVPIAPDKKNVGNLPVAAPATTMIEPDFLNTIHCPGRILIDSELEHVMKAPDLQAYMVVCGLLGTHGYINYFAFDLKGVVDTDRLRHACNGLVSHHSALRTSFGIRSGRVLQMVLKAYEPEFLQLSSQIKTTTLLKTLCETDKTADVQLGDDIVRFMLVERTADDHTLLLRISHAQFDGHSLGLIYQDLKAAYEGESHTPATQYTDFSQFALKTNTKEAEQFWRKTLHGSTMTSVIHHPRPPFENVINDRKSMVFAFRGFHYLGITLATLVKAAWAVVLAESFSRMDVVFGYAVTGRNLPMKGVGRVVGDCNNAALVRARLDNTSTILDLLQQIQEQYLAAIPYESMGPRQMIEKCTDWPRWTHYSTSVNHQNYTDAGLECFRIGDATCKISYKDLEVDRRDVQVYSWPPHEGEMKIAMAFCNWAIPQEIVQKMLENLRTKIESFAADVNAPLVLSSNPGYTLPLQAIDRKVPSEVSIHPRARSFRFSLLDPASLIQRVWGKFLTCIEEEVLENLDVTEEMPFYEIGGDLVYAAQLSAFYREEGIEFAMEDLIKCPCKRRQLNLLETICAL